MKRDPHASPHAALAARYLLDSLKSRALIVGSVDEAVRLGYLTDLQWCETLDIFRESVPDRRDETPPPLRLPRPAKQKARQAEYSRRYREKLKESRDA